MNPTYLSKIISVINDSNGGVEILEIYGLGFASRSFIRLSEISRARLSARMMSLQAWSLHFAVERPALRLSISLNVVS